MTGYGSSIIADAGQLSKQIPHFLQSSSEMNTLEIFSVFLKINLLSSNTSAIILSYEN